MSKDLKKLDWAKGDGILPAVIQHANTGQVLMVGYMSAESLSKTLEIKKVTFFSRSKQRLWTKGETSENYLAFVDYDIDCDFDALLIKAIPAGPVCHEGTATCFAEDKPSTLAFLQELQDIIQQRYQDRSEGSYTAELFNSGRARIAQKVGEEAVETILAAALNKNEEIVSEAADLLYHLMVLLTDCKLSMADVTAMLYKRHHK